MKNNDDLNKKYESLYGHFNVVKETDDRESDADFREYRELWKKTAVEHLVTPFPLHLDIEITSFCNLKCPMCPRTHRVKMGQWENKNMSFDFFKRIIDEGAGNGLKAINLNNFGESLMNKDLVKMIRYAKDNNVLDIMMHTNGTLLNEKLSTDLINSGLDLVVFSVDSITKEIYEKIRIGANFEKTMNGIKEFIRIKNELGRSRPKIRISMVRMKENEHEIDNYSDFWGDGVDMITFVDYRNQDSLDNEDRYTKEKNRNENYCCPSLWQRMTINVNGKVTACCRDAGKRLVIGDLNKNTLKEIWEGEILRKSRELHESGKAYEIEACNGCDHIKGSD